MLLKRLALPIFLLLSAFTVGAQTTSVTATVTDPNGIPYKNGSYFISFNVNVQYPTANYNVNGVPINRGPFSGFLDATGTFTQVVADNGLTNPKGSSWTFQICNYGANNCFTLNAPVTGGSANLSTSLSAVSSVITGNATYNTAFSASARGIQIVGSGSQSQDLMDVYDYGGTKFFSVGPTGVVFCLAGCSGGGGGIPGGSPSQFQYNNAGLFGGTADFTFNGTHTFTFGAAAIINLTAGASLSGLTVAMIPNPLNQNTTGQSGTALALAAAPTTCGAQIASIGIAANGNAQCFGSITANFAYMAPNGSAGTPGFRLIVPADIPTLNQNTTGLAGGLSPTPTPCSAGQAAGGIAANGNSINCIATSSPAGPDKSTEYDNAGVFGAVPSPLTPGFYTYGYNQPSTTAVTPNTFLNGFPGRTITGAATTDTILFSDALNPVVHIHTATGTVGETLPTATTLQNAAFAFHYCNNSPQTDTITPTTWTIQTGNAATAASLAVPPGTCFRIYVDPSSATNWLADKTETPTAGGVSSFSGDGALLTNASSVGAVTAALGVAGAFQVWMNNTGSTATPGYHPLPCGALPAFLGDATTSTGSCTFTVVQVEGAAIPVSATVLGTNASRQLVAAPLQGNGTKVQLSTGTVTTNVVAKFDANGNTINSSITDNGTTVSTAEPLALGASAPACAGSGAGPGCFLEETASTPVASVDDLHADSTQHAMVVNNNNTGEMPVSRTTCVNVTPVTVAASVTTDQNLMSCTMAANLLNVVGRTISVHASGIFSTAATSTAQITIKAKLCTVSGCGSGTVINLISIQTVAIGSITVTNNNWSLDFFATTQTAGATAAFESHGQLTIDLGSLTSTADSTYGDTNTATISSIDTTGGLFLQITGAYSAASASNSMSQRQGIDQVLN